MARDKSVAARAAAHETAEKRAAAVPAEQVEAKIGKLRDEREALHAQMGKLKASASDLTMEIYYLERRDAEAKAIAKIRSKFRSGSGSVTMKAEPAKVALKPKR